jgi:CRISPR-associated protein Cmr1
MKRLTIECEIVTPLLMHGANGKKAELRIQSLKGVMRFWWRAVHQNLDLDSLRKMEANVFGDTNKKAGFRMKTTRKNLKKIRTNLLPHRERGFLVEGFEPGQTFTLEFFGSELETAEKVFLLATVLGGFGQRSRRGFGSVAVKKINAKEFSFVPTEENIADLIKEINPGFTFRSQAGRVDYPYLEEVEVGRRRYRSYKELLRQIGNATHDIPCFGRARPRHASPLVVSVYKNGANYHPIITKLHGEGCWNKYEDFKRMIL